MNALSILNVVGYLTATIVFAVGIAILAGFIPMPSIPGAYRSALSVAMIGYGILRAVMLQVRQRKSRNARTVLEQDQTGE